MFCPLAMNIKNEEPPAPIEASTRSFAAYASAIVALLIDFSVATIRAVSPAAVACLRRRHTPLLLNRSTRCPGVIDSDAASVFSSVRGPPNQMVPGASTVTAMPVLLSVHRLPLTSLQRDRIRIRRIRKDIHITRRRARHSTPAE